MPTRFLVLALAALTALPAVAQDRPTRQEVRERIRAACGADRACADSLRSEMRERRQAHSPERERPSRAENPLQGVPPRLRRRIREACGDDRECAMRMLEEARARRDAEPGEPARPAPEAAPFADLPPRVRRRIREACGDDRACAMAMLEEARARRERGEAPAPSGSGRATPRLISTTRTNLLWDPYGEHTDPAVDATWGGRERFVLHKAAVTRDASDPDNPYGLGTLRIDGDWGGTVHYLDEIRDQRGVDLDNRAAYYRAVFRGEPGFKYRIRIRQVHAGDEGVGFVFSDKVDATGDVQVLETGRLLVQPVERLEINVESTNGPSQFSVYLLHAEEESAYTGVDPALDDDPGCGLAGYPGGDCGALALPGGGATLDPQTERPLPGADPARAPGGSAGRLPPGGDRPSQPRFVALRYGPVTTTPVSGSAGDHVVTLDPPPGTEGMAVAAVWVRDDEDDKPCQTAASFVNGTDEAHATINLCEGGGIVYGSGFAWVYDEANGAPPVVIWQLSSVRAESPYVGRGIGVCQRRGNGRVKGLKMAVGEIVEVESRAEVVPVMVTMPVVGEVPMNVEDELPNCNDWQPTQMCPTGQALVGIDVHYEEDGDIVGLAGRCAALRYGLPQTQGGG